MFMCDRYLLSEQEAEVVRLSFPSEGAGTSAFKKVISFCIHDSGYFVVLNNDIASMPSKDFFYHEQPMIWLLVYLIAVSMYDLRTRRIPNWSTYPLILAGMIAHFPGHMDLWLDRSRRCQITDGNLAPISRLV